MIIYLKYIGSGSLDGVPARDLTKEEAESFGVERLIRSGLYERAEAKMRQPEAENKMVRPKSGTKRDAGEQ